jgi:hypothetical protein
VEGDMSQFVIDFKWLARDYGSAAERATLAEVTISAAGQVVTVMEDLAARTVCQGVRVSALALADWFAANWWRLRWEPARNTAEWKMSHKTAAAGKGFLWPDITFSSDGETVHVHAKSSPLASKDPVRYLSNADIHIPAAEFERGIDRFMEAVIGRLMGADVEEEGPGGLWNEVLSERRDPKLAAWRKIEAIMGFDPDEAPEGLIEEMQKAQTEYGTGAVEEMAAESMGKALEDICELWETHRKAAPLIRVPCLEKLRARIREETSPWLYPWQRAAQAALFAREEWSLGEGPVPSKDLSGIFEISGTVLDKPKSTGGPVNAGFRNGGGDTLGVFLKSPYPVNRRFALLRLVGDMLTAPQEDKLLPASNAHTRRQKFQRAFAQELLCPYSELRKYIGDAEPTDELIEDAASFFEVSSRMVETVLVNKGFMERSSLPETGIGS